MLCPIKILTFYSDDGKLEHIQKKAAGMIGGLESTLYSDSPKELNLLSLFKR